jgi:hypothetical protein
VLEQARSVGQAGFLERSADPQVEAAGSRITHEPGVAGIAGRALGYRTPAEFAAAWRARHAGHARQEAHA